MGVAWRRSWTSCSWGHGERAFQQLRHMKGYHKASGDRASYDLAELATPALQRGAAQLAVDAALLERPRFAPWGICSGRW